jgi:NADP-dependent 3-hydroxy acid dehydrogenase YdfG
MSFAQAGVKGLVLVATDAAKLKVTASKVHAVSPAVEVLTIAANIVDAEAVATIYAACKVKFGHADVLINNAGINFYCAAPRVEEY